MSEMRETAQSINTEVENEAKPGLYSSICLQLKRFKKTLKAETLKEDVDAHLTETYKKVCKWKVKIFEQ